MERDPPVSDLTDSIERIVSRLKGETIVMRRPADFAPVLKRIGPHERMR
jgi:hypothetical protein